MAEPWPLRPDRREVQIEKIEHDEIEAYRKAKAYCGKYGYSHDKTFVLPYDGIIGPTTYTCDRISPKAEAEYDRIHD